MSHKEGGMAALAKLLMEKFPAQIQTLEMAELKLRSGVNCKADHVKKIRSGLPDGWAEEFLLKGELRSLAILSGDIDEETEKASKRPTAYPAQAFFDLCHKWAKRHLEADLNSVCLDPKSEVSIGPWYFVSLFDALREYLNDYSKDKKPSFTTDLGQKVYEVLDYTAFSGGLTLLQGEARTGKTFAARAWCEQRPGEARYVEVPPGNDDAGFFRALARGLGLGNFLKYKPSDIRDRVESVLLTTDLLLVLDEAQRLWPQRNLRYGFPHRIVWLMTMANAGVPIAMVATPQFIETQKAVEKNGWNSRQLVGRIKHYEPLPPELSQDDLSGVARAVLPEASSDSVKALAIYARNSARYLAAIDSIADRARYLAMKDGRNAATTADVQRAMKESVIPADSKLQSALAAGQSLKRGCLSREVTAEQPSALSGSPRNEFKALPERSITPGPQRALETPLIGV
ncbi:MAG TPA: ATP-binding protein [Verrucomicrobiae bacterium]|nr:ATP-binding protein [Verrucomicrobiae bacterium]